VRERSVLRQLAEAGTVISDAAYSVGGRQPLEILDEAERRILAIRESGSRKSDNFVSMQDTLSEVMSASRRAPQEPAERDRHRDGLRRPG
jgi:replicative DNA helicase